MDEFIGDSLTRSISAALRRQFLQHFPDLTDLAALLSSSHPSVQTDDALFNRKATDALNQRSCPAVAERVDKALAWESSHPQHHLVGLNHPAYPRLLQATKNAPPVLYVCGDLHSLNTPCIAIVGARKASHNALEQAHQIAQELVEHGVTVVSGLALGIDAAAHRGAINGGGSTIAVSATGPERIYPRSHVELATRIRTSGSIITEFAISNPLQAHCFPRRNRIISGLSLGVLVVEAALPSGTLTTAQHALRQGREVMAMPGSVRNPLSRGCHELIKNGAALVENTQDVLVCLQNELKRHIIDSHSASQCAKSESACDKLANLGPDTLTLLDCLGFDPASIDTLVQRSGLDAAQVAGALTHLEISGLIVADQFCAGVLAAWFYKASGRIAGFQHGQGNRKNRGRQCVDIKIVRR